MIQKKYILLVFFLMFHLYLSPSAAKTVIDDTLTNNDAIRNNNKAYTIQVSSFKKAEDAAQEISILNSHGVDAVSSYEAVNGKGMWHRVHVGRFNSRQEAKKMAYQLKGQNIVSWYWIKTLDRPKVLIASSEESRNRRVNPGQSASSKENRPLTLASKSDESNLIHQYQKISTTPPSLASNEDKTLKIAEKRDPKKLDDDSNQSASDPEKEKGGFSLTFRLGAVYLAEADDFEITKTTGGTINRWQFEKKNMNMSIVPSFDLNKSVSLEGSLGRAFATKLDFWYLSLGPKVSLGTLKNFSPYIRGCQAGKSEYTVCPEEFYFEDRMLHFQLPFNEGEKSYDTYKNYP
ncbi:SPOR domain-containing protein [Thermodesulfobacteriota bacterium]